MEGKPTQAQGEPVISPQRGEEKFDLPKSWRKMTDVFIYNI